MAGVDSHLAPEGVWRPALGVGFVLTFQVGIVAASQTLPVLAPFVVTELDIDVAHVGYFTTIVFAAALISSNGLAGMMSRYGSFVGSAMALAAAAVGVVSVAAAQSIWLIVLGAILIGFGYGPVNPVGSRVLMRVATPRRQNLIFSLKQSSVAVAGAVAGAALPALALGYGWRAAVLAVAVFTLAVAALAFPVRRALGDDAEAEASIRFVGPFAVAATVLRRPELRTMALAVFSFSMMQFGFMSIYVTYLWTSLDMTPALAAAMLSVSLFASIAGRIFWGWRADAGAPRSVLRGLAWAGAASFFLMLAMSPGWPLVATAAFSVALGFGAMSWSGVLLSEVARIGAETGGSTGTLRATSGIMVFAYLGGLLGPALLSASASFGGYRAGLAIIGGFMAATALALMARTPRPRRGDAP